MTKPIGNKPHVVHTQPHSKPKKTAAKEESALRTFARDVVTVGTGAVLIPLGAVEGVKDGALSAAGKMVKKGATPMTRVDKVAGAVGELGGEIAGVIAGIAMISNPLIAIPTALVAMGVFGGLGKVGGVAVSKMAKNAVPTAKKYVKQSVEGAVKFGKWLVPEKNK